MSHEVQEDPFFQKILELVLRSKGFDGNRYKTNYIKRRIAVRMRATEQGTFSDYFHFLQKDPEEIAKLLDRLTIHVTEFFRDPEVFNAVQKVILPSLAGTPNGKIKIWCAGCSTGEEPYSLAMLLQEWSAGAGKDFHILATDIDPASIRTAERAEYSAGSVTKLPKDRVGRWFRAEHHHVMVVKEVRQKVQFRVHDLLGRWNPSMTGFDLIFCRNMLIYLTSIQQQGIYESFYNALIPQGHLVLGLTETLLGPSRRFFKCVDIRNRIYRAQEIPGKTPGSEEKNG